MWGAALFKLVLNFLLLNYSHPILAQDFGLISKSKWNNSPANGQSTREIVNGENVIVAEGISCWEQNGHWEELQVCPPSTIVTGHRFRYLVRTGLTGIQLKCTKKYGLDETENGHILDINFDHQVEKDLPRGKWGIWKNKSSSVFAEAFSFNRGELTLLRSVKNYNMIYHSGNQPKSLNKSTVNSDSGKMYTKCPRDHAICGLTAMMDKAGLGILTAIGFKCCQHCVPQEQWVKIHHFTNPGDFKKVQKVSTTIGLKRMSLQTSAADYAEIPYDVVHTGFSDHSEKPGYNSTGFNWRGTSLTIWKTETPINETYTCEAQSSCVLKQLEGQCGSVRIPVRKFCTSSAPIGSSIPEACTGSSDSIPYQLSLQFQENPPDGPWVHICSGVRIDERNAVTAARCFHSTTELSRYHVVAGENILDLPEEETEQILKLKKIIIHPQYTALSNGNDIAVLNVYSPQLDEQDDGVLLSSVSTEKLSDMSAVISGWGLVSKKGEAPTSNSLQKWSVTILPPEDCLERLTAQMKVPVPEGIVCALNPVNHTCLGGSGGPLVIQNYKVGDYTGNLLVGISSPSVAANCSRQNMAETFTEINHFHDWIQANRDPPVMTSCTAAMDFLPSPRSTQNIYPHGNSKSMEVLCDFDMDGGGWTIIQKRRSGPREEFQQNWNEYVKGFGTLRNNFWLGLENIHALTKKGDQELRIELTNFKGEKKWAKYSNFSTSDASDFYRLSIGGYSGTATDSMTGQRDSMTGPNFHRDYMLNGMKFSTKDKDNDLYRENCAVVHGGGGGWWFNKCGASNLNGLYLEKGETENLTEGIHWAFFERGKSPLAKSEMKIRKKKFP